MRRWLKRVAFLGILLVGVGFVAYEQFWRPVPVVGTSVTRGRLLVEVSGTGLLDAHLSAIVSTKIAGRLVNIEVDQGDPVTKGQLVCQLDDSDLGRQVEVGEASVEVANAAINWAQAEVDRAGAMLELARRDADRMQDANAQGAASVSELDAAMQQYKVALAEAARADAALVEARWQLVSGQRTLDFYRAQFAETVIVSPFTGMVVRRDRDRGDVVVPGSSIVRIVDPGELWLSAWVDETAIASLAPEQEARIVFRSEPAREYHGLVARVGREVDPESREFLVDITLNELPHRWAVGQRAEAYIVTREIDDTLIVPASYLIARDGRRGVFVLSGGRAAWRVCEVGAESRDQVEILSGIDAGDRILRGLDNKSAQDLRPGRRVVIK